MCDTKTEQKHGKVDNIITSSSIKHSAYNLANYTPPPIDKIIPPSKRDWSEKELEAPPPNSVDAFALITAQGNRGEFAPQHPLTSGGPRVGKFETLLDAIIPPSLRLSPKAQPR